MSNLDSSPDTVTTEDTPLPKKKHHPILNPLMVMLVLFGLPYLLAWYFLNQDEAPWSEPTSNHGTLVSPMIPMGNYTLNTSEGDLPSASLEGKWLILTSTDHCDLTCQQTLFTMRQARKSTGVNRKAIVPIVIETVPNALKAFDADLTVAFPKLHIARADTAFLSKLGQAHETLHNTVYVIDPYGNLMMVYPAGSEQAGLMHDLERLLKVNKPKL